MEISHHFDGKSIVCGIFVSKFQLITKCNFQLNIIHSLFYSEYIINCVTDLIKTECQKNKDLQYNLIM